MGEVQRPSCPTISNKVTIIQKLNTQIPARRRVRDETGKAVRMGDYFGKRPVVLSLVYYQCTIALPGGDWTAW